VTFLPPEHVGLTRRDLLKAGVGVAAGGLILARSHPAHALSINPRSSWATDRPPKGPLPAEDVRFLLVHHSASRNGHSADEVPGILRSFYDFHTGPEKGWNDIAYNFLIDAHGGIWEGRAGSIAGSVAGDATGGNQGFSQLVCVIGDYNAAQPSGASLSSLVALLAWLADKHDVSTSAGAEVTFTSRGSNLWPAGSTVTTPTITGHRTMSSTTCPGDNLYSVVTSSLTSDVDAARGGAPPPSTTSTTAATTTSTTQATTTSQPSTTSTTAPTTSADPTPTTASAGSSTSAVRATVVESSSTDPTVAVASEGNDAPPGAVSPRGPLVWTGAGLAVAATAGLAWRYRRIDAGR
jgi:hypothetical protein